MAPRWKSRTTQPQATAIPSKPDTSIKLGDTSASLAYVEQATAAPSSIVVSGSKGHG